MTAVDWKDGATGRFMVDGKNLEFACFGAAPNAAPTIVMLHEGLGSLGLWRDVPNKIADATGMGVFVYSRAGYGNSDPVELPRPLDYMTREATTVLPQVLDGFGFQSGLLLGHSDGATIAAIYAGSVVDQRIRGLILLAPHFFTEPEGLSAIAEAKAAYETGDLKTRLAKHHAHVDVSFYGWNSAWLDPEFAGWNVADVIDYFRIPVLAIQGLDDPYGTLAQITEIDERTYAPLETLLLKNCGHAPHVEHPKQTLAAIAEFAARLIRLESEVVKIA